jgi:hypothetical protein
LVIPIADSKRFITSSISLADGSVFTPISVVKKVSGLGVMGPVRGGVFVSDVTFCNFHLRVAFWNWILLVHLQRPVVQTMKPAHFYTTLLESCMSSTLSTLFITLVT